MSFDKHKELFSEIATEWDKAEEDIKQAEQVCNKVVFPSIKELRYAGRRIIDALNESTNGNDEEVEGLLKEARFDCHRARHDAIDAATSKMAMDVELMLDKLKYSAVLTACPEFSDFWIELDAVRSKIRESRGNRNNREFIYSTFEGAGFPELVTKFNGIRSKEGLMKKLAAQQRFTYFLSIGFGMVGVISLILTLLQ